MGFFSTHWVGEYQGHKIEVVRKVGGHEFVLLIDDETVDVVSSMANMGKRHLEGALRIGETTLPVHAVGIQGAFTEAATVKVGEEPVPMKKIS